MSDDVVSGQGVTFTWGTTSFLLTSLNLSNSSGSEIDITSMSSEVVTDSENTSRKLIAQDYDSCFSARGGGELSIEFFADSSIANSNYLDLVGSQRTIDLKFPGPDGVGVGFSVNQTGLLTQMTLGVATGEFVKGSASFKLSGS